VASVTDRRHRDGEIKKARLASGLLVTMFIRLHRGAQKGSATNLGVPSESCREQNTYANPKRTANLSISKNVN
jgi:hypothetical protein